MHGEPAEANGGGEDRDRAVPTLRWHECSRPHAGSSGLRPESPVVVVGQSLCGKPCMRAQIPFTGGRGRFLNLALERAGLTKSDIFTTNVVHCHPPNNRPSLPNEIENCRPYLLPSWNRN
ncbi:uracil-DNA glycosylase family protein [Mycobacterium arosiense]|uniref:uracil-DNA glycosylase family protein n=1 Tax=Mycobacterium arosiense TaxID=425468 RepID=UPI0027B9C1E5|nr:uracil-DNA glycosylase family protein [Mycobacterium arosiense]